MDLWQRSWRGYLSVELMEPNPEHALQFLFSVLSLQKEYEYQWQKRAIQIK